MEAEDRRIAILTRSGLHRQQRALIVAGDEVISSFNFLIQSREPANVLIRQDRQGEVDEQYQSDGGVQEVGQESGFETTNCGVCND